MQFLFIEQSTHNSALPFVYSDILLHASLPTVLRSFNACFHVYTLPSFHPLFDPCIPPSVCASFRHPFSPSVHSYFHPIPLPLNICQLAAVQLKGQM